MPNELRVKYLTDKDVYAVLVRAADGQVHNGSSFEVPVTAGWGGYALPLAEQDTTGFYYGDMPAADAAVYDVLFFLRTGLAPAPTDPMVGQGNLYWTGSTDISLGTVLPATAAPGTSGGLPLADSANGVRISVGTEPGQVNLAAGKVPVTLNTDDISGVLSVVLAADGLDYVEAEEDINIRQAVSLMTAVLAGGLSGAAGSTVVITAAGWPDITRVTANVDADGNRLSVSLAPPA